MNPNTTATTDTVENDNRGMIWSRRVHLVLAFVFALAVALSNSRAVFAALEWNR